MEIEQHRIKEFATASDHKLSVVVRLSPQFDRLLSTLSIRESDPTMMFRPAVHRGFDQRPDEPNC